MKLMAFHHLTIIAVTMKNLGTENLGRNTLSLIAPFRLTTVTIFGINLLKSTQIFQ